MRNENTETDENCNIRLYLDLSSEKRGLGRPGALWAPPQDNRSLAAARAAQPPVLRRANQKILLEGHRVPSGCGYPALQTSQLCMPTVCWRFINRDRLYCLRKMSYSFSCPLGLASG